MKGLLVQKIGMTRHVCPETGDMIPVTLCFVPENTILQIKTNEKDGYSAAVLGAFERKKGHNVGKRYKFIKEVNLDEGEAMNPGTKVSLATFQDVKKVKITAQSKGHGFTGVIKRHNFSRGPETHGSHHHREPGSIGMCAKPARVLKGTKLPGHYGNENVSIPRADVVSIDLQNNLIALKGTVPGAKKGYVFLREN